MSRTPLMLCSTTRIVVLSLVADLGHLLKYLGYYDRRKSQRWLVEQKNVRRGHQPSTERQHLLLAARHLAGEVARASGIQDGEQLHDRVQTALLFLPVVQV